MKLLALASLSTLFAFSFPAVADGPPTGFHEVQLNGHTFTLPVGFEIELVAGPPLVNRPIVADFDEEGRLYVADSSGSNENVQEQLKKRPHRIVRLEDTRGVGKYDKATVFADKMMFPEGVRWYAGSLYVAGAPSIWKLTDTVGLGEVDRREEWFKGKTLTGCANDLHGPYIGPDGWIYWCKGAFAKQTYERPGREPFVTRAAHIFRCRPDGTGIEPVMTGGMDNPVAVAFTPDGERIFTTTFFQHPAGGRRDGLVHAVYGGVYGKDHDVVYEHPWTGPSLMPVLAHLGAAAPAGLIRYEAHAFGAEYQDNLFAALFNMHKVTRHVLEQDGATFKSRDSDFLVSSNFDFHPTDVLEDADGSLLVIDTGGWYKLCCPTSQLHKPDVLGAIYRIRRADASRPEDPRGLKLPWAKMSAAELARLLDDPRPAVRRRAIAALATKGADAVPELLTVLRSPRPAEARRNAIWAATRIDRDTARAAIREALKDGDESVRQVALHSVSLWRDSAAAGALRGVLRDGSAHNRRAAAEALGRLGNPDAVPILLETAEKPLDRFLQHSVTYALIEIGDRGSTTKGLKSTSTSVRRTALTALDQMPDGGLEPQAVAAELNATDPALRETAAWILGRHPEWGDALAGVLREKLDARELKPEARDDLVRQLAKFASSKAVQQLLAERLRDPKTPADVRRTVLRSMAQSGLREVPATWLDGLTQVLDEGDVELMYEAIAAIRSLGLDKQRPEKLRAALLRIGSEPTAPVKLRLMGLAAVPGGVTDVASPLFDFVRSHLDSDQPVETRALAVEVLTRSKLTTEQLLTLAGMLKDVGPLEVERLLDAFGQSNEDAVGLALVAALKASPARASLRVGAVRPRLTKFGPTVQRQAEELYASLDADAAKQAVRLEELLAGLKDGDVRRGQAVFNNPKVACAACHAIGYLGGTIGPDLTHIGKVRSERDLLESIVFPSASFVRSYEPLQVTTKAGKIYNGLIRKAAPDEIVLVVGANQEVRLAREAIEEIVPGKVSVMPAGLDRQVTPQELADLIAFLKGCQ